MTRLGWPARAVALLIGVSGFVLRRRGGVRRVLPSGARNSDMASDVASDGGAPLLSAAGLHELAVALPPGSRLIFCDDSEVGEAEGMLPDVGLMAAIEMSPASYATASERLRRYLDANDLPEFHATDIVAGRRRSAFADMPPERRLDGFRKISEALVEARADLSYVHIPRSQYEAMRVDMAAGGPSPAPEYKAAIRRVLLRRLIEEADGRAEPTMIVVDQDRPQHAPRLLTSEAAPGLACGGVISAPSDQVVGLQLADMAAFCMGRHLRRRARYRVDDGEDAVEPNMAGGVSGTSRDGIAGLGGFDGVVVETLASFEGRTRSLVASAALRSVQDEASAEARDRS